MTNATQSRPPFNIHLAVDGSEHSQAATRLVADLPLPPGSEITALAVQSARHTPGRAYLLDVLDQTEAVLEGGPAQVLTGILHGYPPEQLAAFADRHKPDLLVIGAKGLRATLGILLGGVAQQLVEYVRWPVLVVRAPYAGLRRVLLATDGSPSSQRARDYLAGLPLPAGAAVEVLHVLPPLPEPDPAALARPVGPELLPPLVSPAEARQRADEQAQAEERAGRALLAEVGAVLQAAGLETETTLARGDAATEIIAHEQAHKVDLVVAGSRGLSAVRGWLLGSVSRKIIHYGSCSVLVVKEADA